MLLLEDAPAPVKPDAVFPNNWVSFHADGTMVLYPMATAKRRRSGNPSVSGCFWTAAGSTFAGARPELPREPRPLPRRHGQPGSRSPAAACLREPEPAHRPRVIADFDDRLDYSTLLFEAKDRSGRPIYHTNVVLSLGTRFAILCTEAVVPEFREIVTREIEASGRMVVEVDYDQLQSFGCNLIELKGRGGSRSIALSSAARRSFHPDQLRMLESFGELAEADIPTIERVGGGSLRCMIADVHLPRR